MYDRETLDIMLINILGSTELLSIWWGGQNKAFGYKTPEEVYTANPQKVVDYILMNSSTT